MSDARYALIALGVLLLLVVAVQLYRWIRTRRWRTEEPAAFLVEELGLERVMDRFLVDTRIVRYRGIYETVPVRVEVGSGAVSSYARIDFEFGNSVPLGVRISSEYEEGLVTRIMRLREVEIGIEKFDSQFILLCRDEERLQTFLDDEVRRRLLELNEVCHDVRLHDEGLHLQLNGETDHDSFEAILDAGVGLCLAAYRRALRILEADTAEDVGALPANAFTPIPGAHVAVREERNS